MTLVEFLLARIAEDEAAAAGGAKWAADGGSILVDEGPDGQVVDWVYDDAALVHIPRWDPARVLAECEAKREIIHLTTADLADDPSDWHAGQVLRLFALPYADHPDYREEWRP